MSDATYKVEAIAALKAFKALKTWKPETTPAERRAGLQALFDNLLEAYALPVKVLLVAGIDRDMPAYTEEGLPIWQIPTAAKSIISTLHHFAGVRSTFSTFKKGRTFEGRQEWAAGLFQKVYPKQYAKLTVDARTGYIVAAPEAATPVEEATFFQYDEGPQDAPMYIEA